MDAYKNEIARQVAWGLGWITKQEFSKHKTKRDGKLSPTEIIELTRKDCARGADGRPVLYSAPSPISKRIKL